jgi:predicted nucleic acid-binding protein
MRSSTQRSVICVDANLVVRLVLRDRAERILELWEEWTLGDIQIVAPGLLRYELTNALHRLRVHGELSDVAARSALDTALILPIGLHTEPELHRRAMDIAARFSLPAAYTAHYLALAELLRAPFWTADQRLARAVQPALAWVHLAQS